MICPKSSGVQGCLSNSDVRRLASRGLFCASSGPVWCALTYENGRHRRCWGVVRLASTHTLCGCRVSGPWAVLFTNPKSKWTSTGKVSSFESLTNPRGTSCVRAATSHNYYDMTTRVPETICTNKSNDCKGAVYYDRVRGLTNFDSTRCARVLSELS